jgi:hypothetical protein
MLSEPVVAAEVIGVRVRDDGELDVRTEPMPERPDEIQTILDADATEVASTRTQEVTR